MGHPLRAHSTRENPRSCRVAPCPRKGDFSGPPFGGYGKTMKNDYLERILRARVYDVALETPLEVAPNLSARLGNRLLLKREDMQPVFSFKCRGAYNKMVHLPAAALSRDVIAGQGTIGLEIVRQSSPPPDAVFVPVGGGGLISGIAAYIKRLRPSVKVIGVEPVDADAMARSLKAGRRVQLDHVGLFADGVAVKQVGELTFKLCHELLDGMVLVDTDQICAAIKDVFGDTRTVLEPAGALAVAGAKAWVDRTGVRGKRLVAVASGANSNFDRLRFVAERAESGEEREAILAVTIPERPGSFKKFCATLGARNITE